MAAAQKRPARIEQTTPRTDAPPPWWDSVADAARLYYGRRDVTVAEVDAAWALAWAQRRRDLRSVEPRLRGLIELARWWVRPASGRPPRTLGNPQKYGSDEDKWLIHND